MAHVCELIHRSQILPVNDHTLFTAQHERGPATPPILIDSGASCSVVGENWLLPCGANLSYPAANRSDREFRFGEGPLLPSLGETAHPIRIPNGRVIDSLDHTLAIRVDVVKAVFPLLISQQALTHVRASMGFSKFTLEIPGNFAIRLTKSSDGRALLPGIITQEKVSHAVASEARVFPMQQTVLELKRLTDSEVLKMHRQLGHCSERHLIGLFKFGGCKIDPSQIHRAYGRR